jgi:class 3 adenylate cyclase
MRPSALPRIPLSLWNRLSWLGANDLPYAQARRIILTNRVWLLSGLTMAVHGLHVAAFDLVNLWPFVLIVISGLTIMAAALLSNHLGHHGTARLMFALGAPALTGWALFWGGRTLGTDLYLFGTWAALFLLVSRRDLWLLASGGLAYALIFILSQDTSFSEPNAGFHIHPDFIRQTEWLCRLQTLWFTSAVLLMFYLEVSRAQTLLEAKSKSAELERDKSERLLENLMPSPVVRRLKDEPGTIADYFPSATILFCDLVGFTRLCQTLPPERVVRLLDTVFTRFDRIVRQYGLEKIKTVGDGYMLAGGLRQDGVHQAELVAEAALALHAAVADLVLDGNKRFQVHMGIHNGPVVAGVIGTARTSYDLWGQTVNIASRLQHHCEPGAILVSDACALLLRQDYVLKMDGDVTIAGIGPVKAWYLLDRKRAAEGVRPSAGMEGELVLAAP